MADKIKELLEKNGQMIIDGSMSTALEQMGANLNCNLWTARALVDTPELVKKVHTDYFKAGADCGITCSYQATIPGLMENVFTHDEAAEIDSVKLLLEAREEWWNAEGKAQGRVYPLCLAGIGPYGAYLADGSEYRGNYGVSDEALRTFHKERMEILWNAGADILLIETQPSLREALIEAEIALFLCFRIVGVVALLAFLMTLAEVLATGSGGAAFRLVEAALLGLLFLFAPEWVTALSVRSARKNRVSGMLETRRTKPASAR